MQEGDGMDGEGVGKERKLQGEMFHSFFSFFSDRLVCVYNNRSWANFTRKRLVMATLRRPRDKHAEMMQ